jgi:PKD repeat protein
LRHKQGFAVLILAILLLSAVSCSDATRSPVAQFLVSVTSGSLPLDVAFDASASYAPGATLVDYSWAFGDGTQGQGATCQHTYVASDDWEYPLALTVTLIVTDSHGKTGTATNAMVITGAPPVARFSATPRSGFSPLTVAFDAAASKDGGRSIVDYAWEYGDGAQGTGVSSIHTYVSPANKTYTVTLTVTDSAGRKGIATDSVSAWGPAPTSGSGGGGTGTGSATITASAGANGAISPSGSMQVGYGADQAFTMAPNANCHVEDVLVDGSSVGAVTTYTFHHVVASHTIRASFAVDTHTLAYTAGAGGAITGPNPQAVEYGGSGSPVTAVADACSHFVRWSDGRTDNPRTDTNVTADHTFDAVFAASGPFTLTYEAGDGGMVSGTRMQTVDCGGDGTSVTAAPDSCSHFVDWSDGITDNPRTDRNVTADVTVTANFAADGPYTLTYTAGDGGAVSGDASQTVACGDDGSEVSADPDPCHHFVEWSDGLADNPRTDTNVTANVTATAIFADDQYTLDYAADAGGAVEGETHQTVDCGASGTEVTAVPDSCHVFREWSDGSLDNSRTDANVTENVTVTATFDAKGPYTLDYQEGDGGMVSGTRLQTVDCGDDGTAVTAVPASCSHFVDWSDGITDNPRTDRNVTADVTVTANFAADGPYTLTYTAGDGGAVSGDASQTVACGDDGSDVSAVPDPCHRFVEWSDGLTDNPRTDTNVTADVTLTAVFADDQYTLDYASDGGGSIEGNANQTVDCGADGSAVTAVPDACHNFAGWSDGSFDNPRTDAQVTENVTVSATFTAKGPYTLEYQEGAGGMINGTILQTVNCGEDGSQVTAVPDEGYEFEDWSDGSTINPRRDLNVMADITVTAHFRGTI